MDNQIIMNNYNKRTLFVKVVAIYSTIGYLVHPKHIKVRKIGLIGVVKGWVPGHGGDIWFVQQDNQQIGVYASIELRLYGGLSE